jgi:chromosome partitioning protein
MKIIAIIGQKGGTGKSTLALALAVEAERRGGRAIVFDLDPQTTAANWSDRRGEDGDGVGLPPAVLPRQAARLAHELEYAAKKSFDIAIIDTPGKNADASIAAAKAADLVLLPIQPHLGDIDTLDSIKQVLGMTDDPPAFVVLNRAPVQGNRHVIAAQLVAAKGLKIFPVVIFSRAAHADAGNIGQTAAEYDPQSKAAHEIIESYSHIIIALKGARHGKEEHTGRRSTA